MLEKEVQYKINKMLMSPMIGFDWEVDTDKQIVQKINKICW